MLKHVSEYMLKHVFEYVLKHVPKHQTSLKHKAHKAALEANTAPKGNLSSTIRKKIFFKVFQSVLGHLVNIPL